VRGSPTFLAGLWAGLEGGDNTIADFLRFTRESLGLRRSQPALRGEGRQVTHGHNYNRGLAFQRWVETLAVMSWSP
jgi:1,4-alpha-glucan branching enzyme